MTEHAGDLGRLAALAAPLAGVPAPGRPAALRPLSPALSVIAQRMGTEGEQGSGPSREELAEQWRAANSRNVAYAGRRAQGVIFGGRKGSETWGRVATCGRQLRTSGADVKIDWHDGDNKRLASLPGETCAWSCCPVCGRSIRAAKAAVITAAATEWETRGGQLVMLTLAPPHHPGDDFADTYARLEEVWRIWRTDRLGKKWRADWRIRHWTSSLEATIAGANGDHPHRHLLLFIDPEDGRRVDADQLAGDLLARLYRWAGDPRTGATGRDRLIKGWTQHGIQASDAGPSAGSYVSKAVASWDEDDWESLKGLGAELTDVGAAKIGRGTSGGVSVLSAAMAIGVAARHDGRGRITAQWINAHPRRRELAGALREWRRLTFGQTLVSFSRKLVSELAAWTKDCSEEELAQKIKARMRAERQALAEARGEPTPEPRELTAREVDYRRPFAVSGLLWRLAEQEWGDQWGGPEVAVCRGLEVVGPWRTALAFRSLAAAVGLHARAWVHRDWQRLRIGTEDEYVGDPMLADPDDRWEEISWAEIAHRDRPTARAA